MSIRKVSQHVDGTIPIQALLYNDEELLANQDNVGIYDGQQKSPNHQSGTVYATSHRLFYIDARNPHANSFSVALSSITRTDHYSGLLRSSPKVTLYLQPIDSSSNGIPSNVPSGFETWECQLCGYKNPPGLSPTTSKVCDLCGVPKDSVPSHGSQVSTSLPASSISLPLSMSASASTGPEPSEVACPACTFLNHPSLKSCEICSTELPRIPATMKSAPSTRPPSPDTDEDTDGEWMIKLSFRKGGDKPYYAVLRRSLMSKVWQFNTIAGNNGAELRSGISGIMRTVESDSQTRSTNMQNALQDLEAFMVKAKEMVKLAEELNERLTATSATTTTSLPLPSHGSASSQRLPDETTLIPSTEPDSANFIRSSLSQLGLQMANAPVTLDMIKDERKWMEELARELSGVLQRPPKGGRKAVMRPPCILPLDTVWGIWNRARGVALIPPSTFLQVLPLLEVYTSPSLSVRTFSTSGVKVLHTPEFSHATFKGRLTGYLSPKDSPDSEDGQTTAHIAQREGISISLAEEMILDVEDDGEIVRDDLKCAIHGESVFGEVRWCKNTLLHPGYVWDGQI